MKFLHATLLLCLVVWCVCVLFRVSVLHICIVRSPFCAWCVCVSCAIIYFYLFSWFYVSVCLVGTSKLLWTASGCSLYPHCLSVSFTLVACHLALRTATKDHRISLLTAKHSGHSLVSESFHETHKDEWISCTNNIYLACAHYTRNTPNGTIYIKLSHIGFNMVGVSGCMKVASNAQFCPFWCRQVTVNVPCYSITLRKTSSLFFSSIRFHSVCVRISLSLDVVSCTARTMIRNHNSCFCFTWLHISPDVLSHSCFHSLVFVVNISVDWTKYYVNSY